MCTRSKMWADISRVISVPEFKSLSYADTKLCAFLLGAPSQLVCDLVQESIILFVSEHFGPLLRNIRHMAYHQ